MRLRNLVRFDYVAFAIMEKGAERNICPFILENLVIVVFEKPITHFTQVSGNGKSLFFSLERVTVDKREILRFIVAMILK